LAWIPFLKLLSCGKRSPDKENQASFGVPVWAGIYNDVDFNFMEMQLIDVTETDVDGQTVRCVVSPDDQYESLHGMRLPRSPREWLSQLIYILCTVFARAGTVLPSSDFSLVQRAKTVCEVLRGAKPNLSGHGPESTFRLGDLWHVLFLKSPGPEAFFWSNASVFAAAYDVRPNTSLDESRVALFTRFQRLVMFNWHLIFRNKLHLLDLSVKNMFISLPNRTKTASEDDQHYLKHGFIDSSTFDGLMDLNS
jgi:hypothetical protein